MFTIFIAFMDICTSQQFNMKNIILKGSANLPISLDIFFNDVPAKKPLVVYAHGFNGFKDWGNFDLIAAKFAAAGYVFVKFNFSHNGTTPDQPDVFADLEAFGRNNYSKQLEDLGLVIDWCCDKLNAYQSMIDSSDVSLIGHSMGGGIALIYAAEDKRIKKLVTWAGISECKTPWGNWSPEKMEEWKLTGVQYYQNGRTKQNMPMYYQLYQDFVQNQDRLNIREAIGNIKIPIFICHGSLDVAVPVKKAWQLLEWQPSAKLLIVESDHVFGRSHPWPHQHLPAAMEEVVVETMQFLQ